MDDSQSLACFEENHRDLLGLAFRMLGSHHEAEDAVQEAWLRLVRTDTSVVRNLPGWLRTVTSRVCLDMLRSRRDGQESWGDDLLSTVVDPDDGGNPEDDALEAESVSLALLVVLNALGPAERVAFVLHDMFGVPFNEVGQIVGRSQATAKKLASRARRRVHGPRGRQLVDVQEHREVVAAFRVAACTGDVTLVARCLAPDVVRRVEADGPLSSRPVWVHGAAAVAREISQFGSAARLAEAAVIDGRVGLVVAPGGRLRLAVCFVIEHGLVKEYELVTAPGRLRRLCVHLLPDQ